MKEDILYHYTSVDALFNILNNTYKDYIKMRASYFMNMNDPNDCIYFINELSQLLTTGKTETKQTYARIIRGMNEAGVPYFISLSSEEDSLPMWNMYAKNGHGVAIGFDMGKISNAIQDYQKIGDRKQKVAMKNVFCRLYECKYWDREKIQKDFIETFHLNKDNIVSMDKEACKLSYSIKNPSYNHEKEWRVIFLHTFSPEGTSYPYLINFYIPIDAIRIIKVGPCCNEDLVKTIVPEGLKEKVIRSKVPYRDKVVKVKQESYYPLSYYFGQDFLDDNDYPVFE